MKTLSVHWTCDKCGKRADTKVEVNVSTDFVLCVGQRSEDLNPPAGWWSSRVGVVLCSTCREEPKK